MCVYVCVCVCACVCRACMHVCIRTCVRGWVGGWMGGRADARAGACLLACVRVWEIIIVNKVFILAFEPPHRGDYYYYYTKGLFTRWHFNHCLHWFVFEDLLKNSNQKGLHVYRLCSYWRYKVAKSRLNYDSKIGIIPVQTFLVKSDSNI